MSNVVAGYTFVNSADPITYQKLNLLGNPTVTIGAGEVTIANLAPAATGGGFLGRTASGGGAISFCQLNTTLTWPTCGIALSNGGATEFTMGISSAARLKIAHDGLTSGGVTIQNGISTGSLTAGGGAVTFATGTLTFTIGNGTDASSGIKQVPQGSGGTFEVDILMGAVNSAISTSANNGFVYIKTCAGAATGAPDNWGTAAAAMVVDSTNHRLYFRYNGAWKYAALT